MARQMSDQSFASGKPGFSGKSGEDMSLDHTLAESISEKSDAEDNERRMPAEFVSPSTSVDTDSEIADATRSIRSLTGMQKKQLAQLVEQGIDDDGCAAILNVAKDMVEEFRNQAFGSEDAPPSPDKNLDQREERQLRELFCRQVTPGTCANILHVDIDSVNEFKAKEEAKAAKADGEAKQGIAKMVCKWKDIGLQVAVSAKSKGSSIVCRVREHPSFRVSATSAAVGTVAGGVTGGGAGTVVGSVAGVVVGMGPALFTFGLSIPISATVGGGIGLCVGTVTGATAGAMVGGAAGYAGFTHRKGLEAGGGKWWSKASVAAETLGIKNMAEPLASTTETPVVHEN